MGNARRVVLKAVHLAQPRADPIGEHRPVGGGAVMVRGREPIEVKPAAAACRQDDRGGAHKHEGPPLHVVDDRADAGPVVIGQELDDRATVPGLDAWSEVNGLPQHAHHLQAGEIAE